jgi:hypothetical protein
MRNIDRNGSPVRGVVIRGQRGEEGERLGLETAEAIGHVGSPKELR